MRALLRTLISPMMIFGLILTGLGLANLYSATLNFEVTEGSPYFTAQCIYAGIGFVLAIVLSSLDDRWLHKLVPFIYGGTIFLLLVVLILGITSKGAQSWIDLGFVRVQPSEFGKIGLVCMLAWQLARFHKERSFDLPELFWPLMIFLVPTLLVVLQNDLGSSLFYGCIFFTMIFLQGVRLRFVVVGVLLIGILGLVSYNFLLKPYQKNRIVSFMEPERDPRGAGYHLVQSKIAVGSGGLTGKGYKKGVSHRLKFLPERHTDFAFPVWLEEWGFLGGLFVLLMYGLFLACGVAELYRVKNRFSFFMGIGLLSIFFWHLIINVGGVLGLMPLTGVPLPFFSYGGSALLANWVTIGLLIGIYKS